MTPVEISLSKEELKEIKSKYIKSFCLNILFVFISGLPLYFVNENGIRLDWSILLFDAIFLFFFILFLFNLIGKVFNNDLLRDLNHKIKIKTQIRVSEKNTFKMSSQSEGYGFTYRLIFEKNDYLTVYDLFQTKVFDKINIGDIIEIESSKYTKTVLKIEWNNINIKNKNYIK